MESKDASEDALLSGMNRGGKKLASYGQEFEEDEDESGTVSKKPTAIQDQIVTDEKGKRRFHGAFTGGFSAGYWNTVGSKQGWVPQEFSSSRDSRGDRVNQRAEDFMDAEDLGEYGIGNRSIQKTSTFGDAKTKRKMAWERDSTSVSAITKIFEDVVKPVSDSIGVKMLRSMGWREGRGIGLANVKQKKTRGGETEAAKYDREQASKIAPSHEFANEDVLVKQLQPLSGAHGIGYEGLRHSSVLDESYGRTALALKANSKSKGIRGQAFGVGAFENEDESVYTNYDLAQFDFSLDVSGRAIEDVPSSAKKVDSDFEVQPKRLNARKFYAPPRLPPNFRGEHKPIAMDTKRLPSLMKDDVKNMTALQRAKFLGEDRVAVMELAKSAKDQKTTERRSRWDIKAEEVKKETGGEVDEERDRRMRNRVEFPDEPMKQARFKEFLHYIRRGLPYPQPTDLSVWEWESEKKEFETKLTVEERAALPEVKSRSQPLARTAIAAPIHEIMASKFVKEAKGDLKVGRKDEDKLAAVKMEMFGEKTRQSFDWYPDNLLARRFNVPNPYPGAEMTGVPHLQRSVTRKENFMELGLAGIGMPNTANELEMRERLREKKSRREEEAEIKQEVVEEDDGKKEKENKSSDDESDEDEETVKEVTEKAPKSFFDYVFGDGESSSDEDGDDSDEEREKEKKKEKRKEEEFQRRKAELERRENEEKGRNGKLESLPGSSKQDVVQIGDDDDDDIQVLEDKKEETRADNAVYGPTPPSNLSETNGLTAFSVLKYLQEDLKKRRDEKKNKKKSKKKEKKSKKEKKEKKHKSKDDKKKKKKKYDESSTSSDEWEENK